MSSIRDCLGSRSDLNAPFLYSIPSSESAVTDHNDASVYRKTEQVVGSIQTQNSTTSNSLRFPTSPNHTPAPGQKNSPPLLSNTDQSKDREDPLMECRSDAKASETTPLIGRHSGTEPNVKPEVSSCRRCGYYYYCAVLLITLTFVLCVITAFIVTFTKFKTRESIDGGVIYRMNDTVLVTEARSTNLLNREQVELKLSGEIMFYSHTVHVFTTPCDNLTTHNSTVNIYTANMSVDRPDIVVPPTYLVHGSSIEVLVDILDASVIDIDISLYIFKGLDEYPNYASHLDKSTYQATVYISGPGMQNTSTLVNYTVQSTDYYFVVIDSNAPVIAQFDITLHKQLYHKSDYKEVCAITGGTECSLSVSKCVDILAHSTAYTHDLQWLPAHITVTIKTDEILTIALSASISFIFMFLVLCLSCLCCVKIKPHKRPSPQKRFCKRMCNCV